MPRGKAAKTVRLIASAREILAEIQPASVRAVCYKLFTRGELPDMSKGSTNRVSRALTAAREERLIPWSWIVDETRDLERAPSWNDPAEFSEAVKAQYRRDRWATQADRVEVWSEKGTIRGMLAPVLEDYGVGFRVMHGYTSATDAWNVARESRADTRRLVALYVGDWDPSGLHMSEVDLVARLRRYRARGLLRRLALSPEDVERGGLPYFLAEDQRKDPRYRWYVTNYGRRCWELDALDPNLLRARVEAAIREYIDWPSWELCALAEQAERTSLVDVLSAGKAAAS